MLPYIKEMEDFIFLRDRIVHIAHQINLRIFQLPVDQLIHTANSAKNTFKFAV